MTKQLVEVITSVERRRRWSREEKERLVAATLEPTANVSEIARSAGIHVSQLFRWRKELCQISAPSIPQLVRWRSSKRCQGQRSHPSRRRSPGRARRQAW
ncbi:transposase-like protein (plasmid) [Ensifer sp. WSM1721]|uniref:transposase n=1 Tax=Ensifer sp. WSM1721 TaxID=1041159 RepID=UPI0009FD804B|nr:transposase [Ensifer sp. WSM1721]